MDKPALEANQTTSAKTVIEEYEDKIRVRDDEISVLREQVKSLKDHIFGKKSEKLHPEVASQQIALFEVEEAEQVEPSDDADEPSGQSDESTAKKKRGSRKPLPEWLPRKKVIHDLPEVQKVCGCGSEKSCIGDERCEILERIPAKAYVAEHIRLKYACKNPGCDTLFEDQSQTVMIAQPVARMIPKGIAGHSILAHVLTAKFADWLPFNRVEKQLRREHLRIPRQTMCRWAMKVATSLKPMWDILLQDVKKHCYLQMDETGVQVLNEPDRDNSQKSFMWVIRGGPPEQPIVLYKYHQSRASSVAKELLQNYQGIVQTDGYEGYSFLDAVNSPMSHSGCLVHARRKFTDVIKAAGKKRRRGYTDKVLELFAKLYAIERKASKEGLDETQRHERRQRESKPIMGSLHKLLLEIKEKAPPASLLGKATNYSLNQFPKLLAFLDDGLIKLDTNDVENAIRPFVVGRKAWMFSGDPKGAEASAILYSVVETAKAAGWEPHAWMVYAFDRLPLAQTEQDLRNLLPSNPPKDDQPTL